MATSPFSITPRAKAETSALHTGRGLAFSLVCDYPRCGPGVPFRCAALASADEKSCFGMLSSANSRRSEGARSLIASTTISTVSSLGINFDANLRVCKIYFVSAAFPLRMVAWGMRVVLHGCHTDWRRN
jgi:hypothetical protein